MTNTTSTLSLRRGAVIASAFVFALVSSVGIAEAATVNIQLDIGQSGVNVTALQTFLATDSSVYPEGLITGYFGSLTQAAVMRYQTKMGIAAVGRVGPQTLASINGASRGTGSTSGDLNAPIVNTLNVSTTVNSANLSWTTNELVRGRVMYATYWPYLFATVPSVTTSSGLNAAQAVTINGLQSHTTYYYTLESIDQSNNLTWTIDRAFTTQ